MKDKEYYIGDVRIKITSARVFATVSLQSFAADRLANLVNSLAILRDAGFTKYDTTHEMGYYDEVEGTSLELYEEIGKINLEKLKPQP